MTVAGSLDHTHLEDRTPELRRAIRIVYSLRLRSLRLGLIGIADVIEFHKVESMIGAVLPNTAGWWRPFPIEYKSGRLREEEGYRVQLCAQALCLEEMIGTNIPAGAIFYGQPRRRLAVVFSPELRRLTEDSTKRLHELTQKKTAPPATYEKKCRSCSLLDLCLPKAVGQRRKIGHYLNRAFETDADGS